MEYIKDILVRVQRAKLRFQLNAKTSFKTVIFYDIEILPEQIEIINQTKHRGGVTAPMVDSGKSTQKSSKTV